MTHAQKISFIKSYLAFWSPLDLKQIWRVIKCNVLLALGFPRLRKIFICPSHDCNADCVHCYEKFLHKTFNKILSTAAVKDVIDQFYGVGGYSIFFCSGEFLLRADALELIRYARHKSMLVTLVSNGILLDEKKIDDVTAAGLNTLIISIDSADAERHDKLRGVKGCFEKAVNALRVAGKKGLITRIWTYVSPSNRNELSNIVKLGKSLNVIVSYVYLPLLSGRLFDRPDENFTFEERQRLRQEFNYTDKVLLEFPSEHDSCRGGGNDHICVMPSGDATFCPPVPYSYGNVADTPLKDLLADIRADHRRFAHCRGQCMVNFPEYRSGCRAKFMYDEAPPAAGS